jgi:hypothetical protein
MEPRHIAFGGAAFMFALALSVPMMTACDPALNGASGTSSSSSAQGSEQQKDKPSGKSNSDTTDAKRLPCHNGYPSNSTIDSCGLHFQEQTVVKAQLANPAKIYAEIDSVDSLLNTEPACAAERCAKPAPAGTEVQVICSEGDRFGIVAPPEHIIYEGAVSRYTTSMVGGKKLPGFEGEGTGVPVGYVDHSDIANLDEVNGELNGKLDDRFKSTSCDDQRIVITDREHREGWFHQPSVPVANG